MGFLVHIIFIKNFPVPCANLLQKICLILKWEPFYNKYSYVGVRRIFKKNSKKKVCLFVGKEGEKVLRGRRIYKYKHHFILGITGLLDNNWLYNDT